MVTGSEHREREESGGAAAEGASALPKIQIVPCTRAHGEHVADHIAPADAAEIAALAPFSPRAAISLSLRHAVEAWAGLVDGAPVCVFGVGSRSLIDGVGVPWLLGVVGLERHARPFLRRNRLFVARWRHGFERLENHVDARHAVAIRWLRWLGFTLDAAAPWGYRGRPFHRFTMTNR